MKKLYTKPFIAVESFQLNAAVAAGACSSINRFPINHGEDTCSPANAGLSTELYIGNECKKDIINSDVNTDDGLCYQALEGITDMYLTS